VIRLEEERLFRLNVLILLLAVLAGSIMACVHPSQLAADPTLTGSQAGWSQDFLYIAAHNLLVELVMLLGTISFGLISVLVIVLNGFRLGHDISGIWKNCPQELLFLSSYVFLEASAFCLAAGGSESLGFELFYCLIHNRRSGHAMTGVACLITATFLLVAAAAVEATAICIRNNRLLI